MWPYKNRQEAGVALAEALALRHWENLVILAMPRGGVVVAAEVAQRLHLPLNVVVSRKIGAPGYPEYGIGAVSEDERPLFNPEVAGQMNVHGPEVLHIVLKEKEELRRRIDLYRHGEALPPLEGKTILLIDDGLATGVSAAAAGRFLRSLSPHQVILAVPVGPQEVGRFITEQFDEVICLKRPSDFHGVGVWYENFAQTDDEEVMRLLNKTGASDGNQDRHKTSHVSDIRADGTK